MWVHTQHQARGTCATTTTQHLSVWSVAGSPLGERVATSPPRRAKWLLLGLRRSRTAGQLPRRRSHLMGCWGLKWLYPVFGLSPVIPVPTCGLSSKLLSTVCFQTALLL
jgi:hypothetical protein